MFGQALAEFAAGAEKAGLGGGFGDAELLGDFGERQTERFAKEERLAEEDRDAADFLVENRGDFIAAEALFGVLGGVAEFELGKILVGAGVVEIGEVGAAELAEAHQALVDDNAGEPSGEAGVAFKALEMEEGFGVGVLDFVFGVFVVTDDGAGKFEAGLVVTIDQISESGLIALLGAGDEFGVGVDDRFGLGGFSDRRGGVGQERGVEGCCVSQVSCHFNASDLTLTAVRGEY